MIETEQSIVISAAIEQVWAYVNDIQRWANLMPGCRSCAMISPDDSRWTLKVGVGGLVRTVNVLVHVDRWDGPERVQFSYQLEGDPVVGGGAYTALRKSDHETEVTFKIRVEGSGSMAPMWEAMCKPLLPQLAKSFAKRLKDEIEQSTGPPLDPKDEVVSGADTAPATCGNKLRNLWRSTFGSE